MATNKMPKAQRTRNQRMRLQSLLLLMHISSANQKEPLRKPKNLNKIVIQKSGMECGEFGLVIIRSALVRDRFSAGDAPVDDHPALGAAKVHADGLHQSAAGRRPVSRTVFIHVLAPEALWTVVAAACVLQRLDRCAAVFTGEWFLTDNERHECMVLRSVSQVSRFVVLIPHLRDLLGAQISEERFDELVDEYFTRSLGRRTRGINNLARDQRAVMVEAAAQSAVGARSHENTGAVPARVHLRDKRPVRRRREFGDCEQTAHVLPDCIDVTVLGNALGATEALLPFLIRTVRMRDLCSHRIGDGMQFGFAELPQIFCRERAECFLRECLLKGGRHRQESLEDFLAYASHYAVNRKCITSPSCTT